MSIVIRVKHRLETASFDLQFGLLLFWFKSINPSSAVNSSQ